MKYLNYICILISILFTQTLYAEEKLNIGKNIFLEKGNCATCHALSDAGSDSNIGPNLNQIRPDIGRVINAVTNGIGVMPSYINEISEEEIEAVAYYVFTSTNN